MAAACSRDESPEAASSAAEAFAEWAPLLAGRLHDDGINPGAAQSLSTMVVTSVEGAVILFRAACSTSHLSRSPITSTN